MKKKIIEALTTKFPGVSASVLERIATKLSKTVTSEDAVTTAVEGVTFQQIIDSYTDSRVTEAAATARENAVKDYEQKYGLKEGKAISGGGSSEGATKTKENEGDDVPAWAKALMSDIAALKTSKVTNDRKTQLNAVIGKLDEPLRKAYERLPLDKYSDEDFTNMLTEITTEVEGIANDDNARGGVFGRPSANQGNGKNDELTKAQLDAINYREGVQTGDGQPF